MVISQNGNFFILQLLNFVNSNNPTTSETMITELISEDMITEVNDKMITEG